MKVFLVAVNNERFPYPVPPLGASYIGKAIEQAGHDLEFLDLCFATGDGQAALLERLAAFEPNLVAFSIRNFDDVSFIKQTSYLPRIIDLAQALRQHSPAPLLLGGSGFSIMPRLLLEATGADWGVLGPGETAIAPLLAALEKGGSPEPIPGLCWLEQGELRQNPKAPGAFSQEAGYDLIDLEAYASAGGLVNVLTKRGCPFKCAYCTYPAISGTSTFARDPAEVVRDLAGLAERGLEGPVFFTDDIFNHPRAHAAELARQLAQADLGLDWYAFASPRGFDEELAELFVRARCRGLEFGTDAAHADTIKGMQKEFGVADITRSIAACNQVGLPAAHYMIFMGPGESQTSFEATLELFDQNRPSAVIGFVGARIFPETPLYQRALADGLINAEEDLGEPKFYLSPQLEVDQVTKRLKDLAQSDRLWQVPGLGPPPDKAMLERFFKAGYRGPVWDLIDPKVMRRYRPPRGGGLK